MYIDYGKNPELDKFDEFRNRYWDKENERPCLHNGCGECHGTGRKANGSMCVHMISCPCPKCSPVCL